MIGRRRGTGYGTRHSTRRGLVMLATLMSIPLATVVIFGALTQLETVRCELQRVELRLQARLLAESALERWDGRADTAAQAAGTLDGAGFYRIEAIVTQNGVARYEAIGQAQRGALTAEARIGLRREAAGITPVSIDYAWLAEE